MQNAKCKMQNCSLPLEGKGDRIAVDEVFLSICAIALDMLSLVPTRYITLRLDMFASQTIFAKANYTNKFVLYQPKTVLLLNGDK